MDVSARLRDFPVLALIAFGLLVSAPYARADDAFVLNRHLPTLRSLAPPAHVQTAAPEAPVAAATTATATVEPICDVFANGYDEVGATPCAGCFDTALDFTETDVDCGGVYCKACTDGQHCAVGSDCGSTVCNTATTVCAPASCADITQDGTETDVDCGGGICPACAVSLKCNANSDCASNACDALSLTCVSNQCADHRQDGTETGVDCGGGACSACANGMGCSANGDCTSNACDALSMTCVSNDCVDHHLDSGETDIDCGGGFCPACAVGKQCALNSDCTSVACDFVSGRCVSNLCFDQRKDGSETDIDCGGGTCGACGNNLKCSADSDCLSNACDALSLTCVANQCADHRKDGVETDTDCGGGTCSTCANGLKCNADFDCTSNSCDALTHVCH
jgi:hypothetical protein